MEIKTTNIYLFHELSPVSQKIAVEEARKFRRGDTSEFKKEYANQYWYLIDGKIYKG